MPDNVDDYTYARPTQYLCLGVPPGPVELDCPIPQDEMPDMTDSSLYDAKPEPLPRKPIERSAHKVSRREIGPVQVSDRHDYPAPLPSPGTPGNQPAKATCTAVSPSKATLVAEMKSRFSELKKRLSSNNTEKTKGNKPQASVSPFKKSEPKVVDEVPDCPYEVVDPRFPFQKPSWAISADAKSISSNDSSRSRYESLHDIPDDLSSLSTSQVTDCLELLTLSKHIHTFQKNAIDGCLLLCLDNDMLTGDLNFSKFEATKLVQFTKGWRPNTDT